MSTSAPNPSSDPASRRILPYVELLLLSLFWALSTLRPELLPNLIPDDQTHFPAAEKLFLPCALLAIVASSWTLIRRDRWPRGPHLLVPILSGFGLFVLPVLLSSYSDGRPDPYTRTILFTLIPILSIILEPYINPDLPPSNHLALPAALVAVFGALGVFPIRFPDSLATTVAFVATIIAATSIAAASCLAARSTHQSILPFAAIAGFTSAASFAILSLAHRTPIWTWRPNLPTLIWTTAVELPPLLLLFPLLCQLSATRAAVRYLLAPLITILAGAILLQQSLSLRTSVGLLLMATGAIYLLFAPGAEPNSTQLGL